MQIVGGVLGLIVAIVAIVVGLALYFVPTIIASRRQHHAAASIFFLNLFLGWTLVIWIVCLIWANSSGAQQVTVVNVPAPPAPPAESAAPAVPGPFCSSCGTRSTGGTFCSSCGTRLA